MVQNEELKRKLYQVNIHTSLAGDAMVTLIYHRALGDAWSDAARGLRQQLQAAVAAVAAAAAGDGGGGGSGVACGTLHVIGRSHKQKVAFDEDFVTERLTVNGRELVYK